MTTKTYRLRKADMECGWHVLDASERPLGRLASEAAGLLLGKHKATYEPHLPMGDYVVIVNAERMRFSGNKSKQKIYYRHSGYPGGLRERSLEEQMARDPRRVMETAVRGMLPHNALGRELFRHLKVYTGPDHPHGAQVVTGNDESARSRAARRVTGTEQAAPEPAPDESVASPARPRSLSRWRRAELDKEARRLGIEIEPKWKKPDVIAAIQQQRAAIDVAEE